MLIRNRKRVGILGGTFNPIHLGHLLIAENAYDKFQLDKILIMPTGNSYMKNQDEILPTKQRIQMISLAISDNKHFELSTVETDREGKTYTCDTLEILKSKNPDTEYFFIIGADNVFKLDKWKHADQIFKNTNFLIAERDHISHSAVFLQMDYYRLMYKAKFDFLDTPSIDISSNMIRDYITKEKSIHYMVKQDVEEYIRKNGLYRG